MKRKIAQLGIIVLLIQLLNFSVAYASSSQSSFTVRFGNELNVKSGENVNVPIIIDSVNIANTVQRGIVAFNCKFKFYDDTLEMLGTTSGSTTEYFHANENISAAINKCYFTKETNALLIELDVSRLGDGRQYIDSYTELGYITLHAAENAKDGFYPVSIVDVEGGNDEQSVRPKGSTSYIHVDGIKEQLAQRADNMINEATRGTTTNLNRNELMVSFNESDDGTKLFIHVDEQNGAKVASAAIDGNALEKKGDYFEANVEPGKAYAVSFYDENGNTVGIKWVNIENRETINDGNTTNDTNTVDNSQEQKSQTYSTSSSKSGKSNNAADKTKGALTGDKVLLWIGLVVFGVVILGTGKKISKLQKK